MSKLQAQIKARNLMTDLLYEQEGKFVGVTFETRSGRIRELNGRLGVHRYLTKGLDPQAADTWSL